MWRRKFLRLRRASLVSIVLIWSASVLYSNSKDSKERIELKVGMGGNPFVYFRGLLSIEREKKVLTIGRESASSGLSFNISNNSRLILTNKIWVSNWILELGVEPTFEFSPRVAFYFYNRSGRRLRIALSGGAFLGGTAQYYKRRYSKEYVKEGTAMGFGSGVHFQPTFRLEIEELILECGVKVREILWEDRKYEWYAFPSLTFEFFGGAKTKDIVYKLGMKIVGREEGADGLWECVVFWGIIF
jgi:hypothetical protein